MSNSGSQSLHHKPAFTFVDLSNPQNAKDASTRKVIRQQAMRDVGLSRRKARKKRGAIEVAIDESALAAMISQAGPVRHGDDEGEISQAGPVRDGEDEGEISPYQLLGGGEMDPFLPYPIPLDKSARELVANMFRRDGGEGILRAHRDDWFAVGLSDPLPFHLVLSNAALGFEHLHTRNQDVQVAKGQRALKHFVIALRGMKDRLNEEAFRTSDAAIGAVVGFMCHDVAFGDGVENWLLHRKGIVTMISLRGGINAINSNQQLRVSVSWVDIRGAYVYDVPCQFPMPPSAWACALDDCAELVHRPSSDNLVLKALKRRDGRLTVFASILADLIDCSIATSMLLEKQGPAHWTSRTDGGGWTQNIIHRLLSYRPLTEAAGNEYLSPNAQEACRLGALLYIAPIWRKFGAAPVVTTVLVRKLLAQMLVAPMDWGDLGLLRAWVLAVGALEAEAENAHLFRSFIKLLAQHLMERHVLSWEQIFPSLETVVWMKESLLGAEERLSDALDHFIQRLL